MPRLGTPWLGGVIKRGHADKLVSSARAVSSTSSLLTVLASFVSTASAVSSTSSTLTDIVNTEMIIRMAIGTGASQSSVTQIPANAVVVKSTVTITTPYSGGATIDVGYAGSTSALQASANNDNIPQTAGDYNSGAPVVWAGTNQVVVVTVGGAPGAGAGFVLVEYANPLP